MPHVIVTKPVPAALRQFITGRAAVVAVWNRLYADLEERSAQYRGRRDPDDERAFLYEIAFWDAGRWVPLRFSVDDATAPGVLFVNAVSSHTG